MSKTSLFTQAVTVGRRLPASQAVPATPPIVPSVGFVHESMIATDAALDGADFVYARNGSPNSVALERLLAAWEGAAEGVVFSSGMAALHAAIIAAALPGSTILAAQQLYGVTRTLLDWLAHHAGYTVHYADFLAASAVEQAITKHQPVLIVCEVLTNPLGRVVPLDDVITLAQENHALTLVDNTFATPFLLKPCEMGADLTVHSTTKFINGHGDVLGGVVAGSTDVMNGVREYRKLLGANLSPFDAWLTLRGARTFPLRMRQACYNAHAIATYLADHPQVEAVYYAGLPADPSYADAQRLFPADRAGATLAFTLKDADRQRAFEVVEKLTLIHPITSLGDIYSEVSHPASSSHRALEPEQRQALGITEGTLRLSCGIEATQDIINDLDQALAP